MVITKASSAIPTHGSSKRPEPTPSVAVTAAVPRKKPSAAGAAKALPVNAAALSVRPQAAAHQQLIVATPAALPPAANAAHREELSRYQEAPKDTAGRTPQPSQAFLRASVSHYHPHLHVSDQPVPGTAMVTLTGDAVACRAPLQVSAVVDTSGSMNADGKLESVKAALNFIVASLRDGDALSITTFDETAQSVTDGMVRIGPMTQSGIQQRIQKIKAYGGTNLSSGIELGLRAISLMPVRRKTVTSPRPTRSLPAYRTGAMSGGLFSSSANPILPAPESPSPAAASARQPSASLTLRRERLAARPFSAAQIKKVPAYATPNVAEPCPPLPDLSLLLGRRSTAAAAASAAASAAGVPRFYVGFQRLPCADESTQLVSVQATLPQYVECVELTAPDGAKAAWRNGDAAVPLAMGPIAIKVIFRTPDYAADEPAAIKLVTERSEVFISVDPRLVNVTPAAGAAAPPPPRFANAAPVQLVLVFTDGAANRGITDPDDLSRTVAEWMQRYASEASSLVTFGFGHEHNATLLRNLAAATEGTYYHVSSAAQIPQLFGDCLGGFTSVAARRVRLSVKASNPAVEITSIRTSYPQMPDGSIRFRNIFAGERRDVVVTYQVHPHSLDAPTAHLPVLNVQVAHCLPSLVAVPPLTLFAVLPVEERPFVGLPDAAIDDQLSRLDVARVMEEATTFAARGDFERARLVIDGARTRSRAVKTAFTSCLVAELDEMESVMEPTRWAAGGCATSNAMQVGHAQQRCNRPSAAAAGYYQTASKSSMAAKASAFATAKASAAHPTARMTTKVSEPGLRD